MKKQYPGQTDERITDREIFGRQVARRAAAEGMVLLENDGVLPLKPGAKLALFGLGARYTIKGGTGSGDVNSRNTVSVDAGLRAAGYDIVNTAWLDEYDRLYRAALADWEKAVYEAAGPERDFWKFYEAHVRLKPESPDLPLPADALQAADAAVFVLSRTSGEGADRRDEKGDYYLSDEEHGQLAALCAAGRPVVVVLNVGGIIDLSFLDEFRIAALVLMGQAGSESGNALADILSGKVNPSGRLTDTWATRYEDYPSSAGFSWRNGNLIEEYYEDGIYVGYRYFDSFGVKPRYPFGYGLSYTTFEETPVRACADGASVSVDVRVCNTGRVPGRHSVLLYAACPAAEQPKEARRLVAFGKTAVLDPGAEETLTLAFGLDVLSSYRVPKAAWYLEKGNYVLLLDGSAPVCRLTLQATENIRQVTNICELLDALCEIEPSAEQRSAREQALDTLSFPLPDVPVDSGAAALAARRSLPPEVPEPDEALLAKAREITGRMTDAEKALLVVGARSAASAEVIGAAGHSLPGAAGETVAFPQYGIPPMILADGPAGLRIDPRYEIDPSTGAVYRPADRMEMLEGRFFGKFTAHEGAEVRWQYATAIPVGTLLAQGFDTALAEEVGGMIAGEMKEFGATVWLAPGMNIHRNPLCGRNFEYFSEDPVVSGLIAAAITRGVQKGGFAGVSVKHFAGNNQEDNRMHVTDVISERALREIYLKGFEIAVRTSQPRTIMTSYNRINGVHSANSYDLCTTAARKEWGFAGYIMTDWTTTNRKNGSSAAKCITAGNDLVMPGTDNDCAEILAALHEEKGLRLAPEKLDESVTRLIYAALEMESRR